MADETNSMPLCNFRWLCRDESHMSKMQTAFAITTHEDTIQVDWISSCCRCEIDLPVLQNEGEELEKVFQCIPRCGRRTILNSASFPSPLPSPLLKAAAAGAAVAKSLFNRGVAAGHGTVGGKPKADRGGGPGNQLKSSMYLWYARKKGTQFYTTVSQRSLEECKKKGQGLKRARFLAMRRKKAARK